MICTALLRIIATALALSAGQPFDVAASAQDLGGALDLGQLGTSMGVNHAVGRLAQRQPRSSVRSPDRRGTQLRPSGPTAHSNISLGYAATPALKRQAMAEFISRIRRKDANIASTVQRAFSEHDYARVYDGLVRGDGLAGNDLANSMTAYTVLGWVIANGSMREPSRASVQAVRAQVAAALADDPSLTAPSMRAKLGEEFKILFVTLDSGRQSAQREGRQREFSNGVAQMLRAQSGRDPRSVRLTDQGIASQ